MTINCSNCGKGYHIDPKGINYKGSRMAYFICNNCHNKVIFDKFRLNSPGQIKQTIAPISNDIQTSYNRDIQGAYIKDKNSDTAPEKIETLGISRFGLRMKMIILFVVIPILFMAFSNLLLLLQMTRLSKSITEQSTNFLTVSGEKIIFEKARAVAQAVNLFLSAHPMLERGQYQIDEEFKKIALQKIGLTGYTLLVSKPDQDNPSRLWVHPKKELIGLDVVKTMKKVLSDRYKDWYDIQEKAFKHDMETGGYYTWLDNRRKFMAMVPVKNSNLFAASTAYIDEFTRPVNEMQKMSHQATNESLYSSLAIIFVTILIIGSISFVFGNIICKKIKELTDITENISVGDMDAKIPNYAKDEIGLLAEGIRRMQDSLKLSLERLRRRRST